METKICSKCKQEKNLNEFNKNKQNKDGLRGICRECDKNIHRHYYLNNKHRLKKINKNAYQQWYKKNKEKRKEYQKKYKSAEKYTQKQKLYSLKYYDKNKEKIAEQKRNNRERINATRRKYIKTQKYKDYYRQKRKLWTKKKFKTDPRFKLDNYFSRYIRGTLKNVNASKANRNWETLVGYNATQLKEHLEKQFKPEMNWDNHGTYWHIDHIKPKSWFKYDSAEHPEFKKCWALENLQPLEAKTNILKSNKYEG